jgi:hypothetical protein
VAAFFVGKRWGGCGVGGGFPADFPHYRSWIQYRYSGLLNYHYSRIFVFDTVFYYIDIVHSKLGGVSMENVMFDYQTLGENLAVPNYRT